MPDIVDEARRRSLALLRRALHPEGFVASPADDHYAAVWGRDAAMTCLGASRSGEEDLVVGTETTLRTLARLAGPHGQIPNAYWPARGYWDWGETGAVDASAWLVIAAGEHIAATGRREVLDDLGHPMVRAMRWLAARDATGTGLVDSPASGDWMDSSLNRSGRVFHVNVLAWWAATTMESLGLPSSISSATLGRRIHGLFWPEPGSDLAELSVAAYPGAAEFPHLVAKREHARMARADRRHFLASVSYGRFVDRCDVLAHALAVAAGLVGGSRADLVLDHLDDTGVAEPFPSRTWDEPFTDELFDAVADARQEPRWRNPPGSYHNGAVWPYVGAAHAAANAVAGRRTRAAKLLEGAARANALDDWGFHEWIRVHDGSPEGPRDQAWNGGAFLWAYDLISR